MSAENWLAAEELAALAPGDVVTVESGMEFGRRRHATATVVRVDAFHVTVSCLGPRGSKYVERYSLRDGLRVGGGGLAELVRAVLVASATSQQARQAARIQELFRLWSRSRGDVDALRRLHLAISEALEAVTSRSEESASVN